MGVRVCEWVVRLDRALPLDLSCKSPGRTYPFRRGIARLRFLMREFIQRELLLLSGLLLIAIAIVPLYVTDLLRRPGTDDGIGFGMFWGMLISPLCVVLGGVLLFIRLLRGIKTK